MLAKEKRRATWSLAIGALISIAYFGWCYLASWRVDTRIQGLVGQYEQRHIRQKFKSYDDFEKDIRGSDDFKKLTSSDQDNMLEIARERYSCDRYALSLATDLKGVQAEIADAQHTADNEFNGLWIFSGIGLLIFGLPLL
jgi:hypothetical protein